MSIKHQTFWYTVYTCDLCGADMDDPYIDDEGDDLCDQCAQSFAFILGYLIVLTMQQEMSARKRVQNAMEGMR